LSFSEFVDIVSKEISKQALNKCVRLAEKQDKNKYATR